MADPFRERQLSPAEVRRILRRALELAEQDAETQAVETSMTEAELVRHAGELGIPRTAIRGAAAEHAPPDVPEARGGWLGAPLKTLFEEEIDGEISSDSHEDLVDVIRNVTGDAGQVQIVGKTLTWTPTVNPQSQPRQLSVTVRSRNGKTRVRVEERYTNFALALFLGIGLGFGLGGGLPIAGAIGGVTKNGFAAVMAAVAVLMLSFLLPRLMYPWIVRRRSKKHRELLSRLSDVARVASPRAVEEAPRKRKRKRIAGAGVEAEAGAGFRESRSRTGSVPSCSRSSGQAALAVLALRAPGGCARCCAALKSAARDGAGGGPGNGSSGGGFRHAQDL